MLMYNYVIIYQQVFAFLFHHHSYYGSFNLDSALSHKGYTMFLIDNTKAVREA